jgi:hypothetical protein
LTAVARSRKWEKWTDIVDELELDLSKPVNHVTAAQVKQFSHEEPRLMAKMDSIEDTPDIFRENGVFLLPVSRREYVIVHGNGFHELETIDKKPTVHTTNYPIPTMVGNQIDSEAIALDYAFSSRLLETVAETSNIFPAFRGRRNTPNFSFDISSERVEVRGAQIEVDGGYENVDQELIFESKMGIPNSFNIRQLYYPFRTFQGKKPVRSFFTCYDKEQEQYFFWEYEFDPSTSFDSIRLVKGGGFRVQVVNPVTVRRYQDIAVEVKLPPQADSVSKIMEFPFRVSEGYDTALKMTKAFGFVERQSSYYRAAAQELGLIELEGNRYRLTSTGEAFVRLPTDKRVDEMCKLLLRYPIISTVFNSISSDPDRVFTRDEVTALLRRSSKISGSTLPRRAQTIVAWFKWIRNNLGLVEVDKDGSIRVATQSRLEESHSSEHDSSRKRPN